VLPSVGAQVSDPDNTVDKADDVKDLWDRFDAAADSQSGVSESAAALKNKLQDLKDTHANGQVGASVVATVPNQTLPFAVVVKSWGQCLLRVKSVTMTWIISIRWLMATSLHPL
jgi:hypothetical protein